MTAKTEDAGHWDVALHETLPAGVSPALYNQDLGADQEGRPDLERLQHLRPLGQ